MRHAILLLMLVGCGSPAVPAGASDGVAGAGGEGGAAASTVSSASAGGGGQGGSGGSDPCADVVCELPESLDAECAGVVCEVGACGVTFAKKASPCEHGRCDEGHCSVY